MEVMKKEKKKTYSLLTTCIVTTEYLVKAKDKEEAKDSFYKGEHELHRVLSEHDEILIDDQIEEIK
jgi:hypothetical protein